MVSSSKHAIDAQLQLRGDGKQEGCLTGRRVNAQKNLETLTLHLSL